MKTLVVYYSRTGHTEKLAKEIAARCGADLERILDDGDDRAGPWGYLRSSWQAFSGSRPGIRRATRPPAEYDLVVIGTPVWNWGLSAPMRTYVMHHAAQFKRVAFFCTEGGSGERRAFAELERLCGQAPVATIAVKEGALAPPRHAQPLRRFLADVAA